MTDIATFTKDQLIAVCRADVAEMSKFLKEGEFSNPSRAALYLRITEIALAALTAPTEPVYQYRIRNGYNGQVTEWQTIRRDQVDFVLKAQPHNAEFQIITPPAPHLPQPTVVPEECPAEIRDLMVSHSDALFSDDDAQEIWNACRAVMLHETQGAGHETD